MKAAAMLNSAKLAAALAVGAAWAVLHVDGYWSEECGGANAFDPVVR